MLRTLATPALRATRLTARRYASAVSKDTQLVSAPMASPLVTKELDFKPLSEADGIQPGAAAFVWEVPKNIPENDFIRRRREVKEHATGTTDLWRKISYYICIPAVILTTLWVYKLEKAHEEHHQAMIDANGGEEPERKVYSYMNIRNKPFPWGNQSLFFNPKYNIPVEEQ